MNPFEIEKITGDNRRPGMKHQEGFLVRYRPHESFGWLCCGTFETQEEAEAFTRTLTPEGNINSTK